MRNVADKVFAMDTEKKESVSGRLVVVVMFLLGLTATGILWMYWHLHMMPFMPLQEALAAEFSESSPRVDGGRRKQHKGTPMILRVVMRVPFDPTAADAENQDQIEARIERTRELAVRHAAIDEYELLEIHMYQEAKEDQIQQKTFLKELQPTAAEPSAL